eukprot:1145875-Pelagomonas_calceolata.AAC.1
MPSPYPHNMDMPMKWCELAGLSDLGSSRGGCCWSPAQYQIAHHPQQTSVVFGQPRMSLLVFGERRAKSQHWRVL